jgi:hypothetical protein
MAGAGAWSVTPMDSANRRLVQVVQTIALAGLLLIPPRSASAQNAPNKGAGGSGFSLSTSLGWDYFSKSNRLAPDYQNIRLRLAASAPSLWGGSAGLRVLLYEKNSFQEHTGLALGPHLPVRHEIRTLAFDLWPRRSFGATFGRHQPVTSALGLNAMDGATLRWTSAHRSAQALLFGGLSVEYWESEFETKRPVFGGAVRLGGRRGGPSGEVSALHEGFESGGGRTRMGISGSWKPGVLTVEGRSEYDFTARNLTYARLTAAGQLSRDFSPYVQAGHRRGSLFSEATTALEGLPAMTGYRGALRDVSAGAHWRVSRDIFVDGRIGYESGVRNTIDGDAGVRAEQLPYQFSGRVGLGAARSIWARSARASLNLDHRVGAGRLGLDASAVGYRWRRPGLSSSTRYRYAPGLRLGWPLPGGANLTVTGRESLDDWMNKRSEVSTWISYRVM